MSTGGDPNSALWRVRRSLRLRARSVAMAWARFCARVRLRLGIMAVRSPPGMQVAWGWPKRCRGGVGAIRLGNNNALPGVVMQR